MITYTETNTTAHHFSTGPISSLFEEGTYAGTNSEGKMVKGHWGASTSYGWKHNDFGKPVHDADQTSAGSYVYSNCMEYYENRWQHVGRFTK